jgi:hypothetical protein
VNAEAAERKTPVTRELPHQEWSPQAPGSLNARRSVLRTQSELLKLRERVETLEVLVASILSALTERWVA